ncbi:glycosyltransferase [Neorhodopirellula lusitana]|uniref:glycosyltransferase n=1 Tax=Neorhodopirellula lusitana TaxID=445327 RepID=UPI00384D39FA
MLLSGWAWSLLGLLAAVAVMQIGIALNQVWAIFRREPELDSGNDDCGDPTSHVMVVLCLRGADPFLADCLTALMNLDYPDYEIRIVVDSADDPAWRSIADSGIENFEGCRIEVLENAPLKCGLKNAALLQVIEQLDDWVGAIALIDADTIAHPSWLSELVAPLGRGGVELTTGIRWYLPTRPSLGSCLRLVWNAAASGQMIAASIPWGGSLAMSRRAVDALDLEAHWGAGLSEDTMLTRLLRQHGMRQRFVPSVIMVNQEDCTVSEMMGWIKRQLLVARLYHPSWPLTVVHGFLSALVPLSCLIASAGFALTGQWFSAVGLGVSWLMYQLTVWLMVSIGLGLVDHKLAMIRNEPKRVSQQLILGLIPAVVIVQLLYPFALISAMFAKRVHWRGMEYQIQSDGSITHQGYRPYTSSEEADRLASL